MAGRRPDPRVDPESFPSEAGEALRVDRVSLPKRAVEPKRAAEAAPKPAAREPASPPQPAPQAAEPPPPSPPPDAMAEERIAPIERRIRDNDWRGLAADLGPLAEVGKLPPTLGLIAALSHHELTPEGDHEAVVVGVRCVAALMNLPEDSAIAGVVARRMFRKNPVRFSERKAPPARVSILIVAATLLLGGAVGWLLSGGWGVVRAMLHGG